MNMNEQTETTGNTPTFLTDTGRDRYADMLDSLKDEVESVHQHRQRRRTISVTASVFALCGLTLVFGIAHNGGLTTTEIDKTQLTETIPTEIEVQMQHPPTLVQQTNKQPELKYVNLTRTTSKRSFVVRIEDDQELIHTLAEAGYNVGVIRMDGNAYVSGDIPGITNESDKKEKPSSQLDTRNQSHQTTV